MILEQQLSKSKSEEDLRLEYAMNNAVEYDKSKWKLIDWYSATRTEEGFLHNDIKTQHQIIISQTDPENIINQMVRLKTVNILEEIAKIMQRFEKDIIHIRHRTRREPYSKNWRGPKKDIIYIEYYLLSDFHFKN